MDRRQFFATAAGAAASSTLVAAEEGRTSQLDNAPEEILDPNRPIIDPHHHLWDHPNDRYLLPEFLADLNAGHRIDKTVYVQSGAMLRADGPPELRSLGETEFANGIAAMSASDTYGKCRVAAAIISSVDFRLKARAGEVLKAHVAAAGGRLRGIRTNFPADKNLNMPGIVPADLLANADYREGFAQLERLGLLSEVWCLFTQLPMVAGLAEAFPKTPIVINHLGTPVLTGFYSTRGDEVFAAWQKGLTDCARRPNTVLKVGGLGMKLGTYLFLDKPPSDSAALAAAWKQYIDTAIGIFGPNRCMFESNYPADRATCSYRTLWNTFKRLAAPYSEAEKTALFSGTAARVYRI